MTSFMDKEREFLKSGSHLAYRAPLSNEKTQEIEKIIQNPALPLEIRAAKRLCLFLENEHIIRRDGENIYAWRTIADFPDIYAPGEKESLQAGHYVHEQGRVCNLSSDWAGVLSGGLSRRKTGDTARDMTIDAVIAYADRYNDAHLSESIRNGAKDYLTALKTLRILHFCLWASNVYHNTLGRFDQYMLRYYEADIARGALTKEQALSFTEEFFLSFNRDSDLYTGMQQGDNGQSMMLGGVDKNGNSAVNALTRLCLTASLNNKRIDPKINLRVSKDTPLDLYVLATELTKQGLGFPQYANDDVVIPALERLGYSKEDARDYTVAACWEFIIPGVGMDIPNIMAISMADAVNTVIREKLISVHTFDELLRAVRDEIALRAAKDSEKLKPLFMEPAPYQSVLMTDYTKDISLGAKYNNYGVHGTGLADACDQLAAVKKYVFDEKSLDKDALLHALETNFESDAALLKKLRTESPKLGRDEECEAILDYLLMAFSKALSPLTNERGGIFRAGTGSAMYYLWHADSLPCLANGHMPGEKLSTNFSPSLLLRDAGPLSVIRAMARPSLSFAINGGPLTLEMHDSVMRTGEGVQKVAQLVRSFILLGGHQLQLNAVNPETLKDARLHPENHKDLIVRVWGWSGHFVQLDEKYQEHILMRTSYQ